MPPGLIRPVHRRRPAGPLGHLPFSRRRQLTTIPKSYLSRIINHLGIRPQRQPWGQPSAALRLTAVRLPEGGRQRHAAGEATLNRRPDASGQKPRIPTRPPSPSAGTSSQRPPWIAQSYSAPGPEVGGTSSPTSTSSSSTRGPVMRERNVPPLAMPWTGSGSSTTRAIWTTKAHTAGWWTD